MASFDNNTITLAGREMLARSIAGGSQIQFTRVSLGDGDLPDAPETLEGLVHQRGEIGVASVSNAGNGVVNITAAFTSSGTLGDFYLREIGLYARIGEEEEILFAYTNAGEKSDFIPAVSASSVVQQGICLQLVTGNAAVAYIENPAAALTRTELEARLSEFGDAQETALQEFKEEVTQDINDITSSSVEELKTAINAAKADLNAAKEDLESAQQGYVKKSGDSGIGDLDCGANSITAANFIGDLNGSADAWNGWRMVTLAELDITEPESMPDVCAAMSDNTFMLDRVTAAAAFPGAGVLEVRRTNGVASACFRADDGFEYSGVYIASGETWSGWRSASGIPGAIQLFAGSVAPAGWLMCHGQSVAKADYPLLYAAIGDAYTPAAETSGATFRLPDFRGMFPRGVDAGRGVDSGRVLGSQQQCGAPNIGGSFYADDSMALQAQGAFFGQKRSATGLDIASNNVNGYGGYQVGFDASRSAGVYKNGLSEIRPVNLAVNFIIKA